MPTRAYPFPPIQRRRLGITLACAAALLATGALLLSACGGGQLDVRQDDAAASTTEEPSTLRPLPAPAAEHTPPPAPDPTRPLLPEPAPSPQAQAPPAPALSLDLRLEAPPDYSDVGPEYAATHAAVLAAGRAASDALLAGDTAALYARFSGLEELLPEDEIEAALQELRGDRVRFGGRFEAGEEAVEVDFNGRHSDATISGAIAINRNEGTFLLERATPAKPSSPLTGRWEGTIKIDGTAIPFATVFRNTGKKLEGAIDVPEVGVSEEQLDTVRFERSVEGGERRADSVILLSPNMHVYVSDYAWGPSTLVFAVAFDGSGTILEVGEPSWRFPLPPDPASDYQAETDFRVPADGTWLVSSGGPTELETHHVVASSQRHAYDLTIWRDGAAYTGDGSENADYWAWGVPVLAPADGTIVLVVDGIQDNTPEVTNTQVHPAGNHVVLRTAADEFVFVAHLQQGSIEVQEGDEVKTGHVLGLTGNSGNSFGPHIHIHAQDEQDFSSRTATGLPLPFTGILLDGEPVSAASPVRGQLVQQMTK